MRQADHEVPSSTTRQDQAFLHSLRDSLPASISPRVAFVENSTTSNIASWFAKKEVPQSPKLGDLIIVGRRKGVKHAVTEPVANMGFGTELRKTLGATAECMIFAGVSASILVVQAAVPRTSD